MSKKKKNIETQFNDVCSKIDRVIRERRAVFDEEAKYDVE